MSEHREGDWIQLASGRRFWPLDPRAEEIDIEDVAHGLANCPRFRGMTREFYSVAQHSVLVAQAVPPEDALWGLLHDAAEAYLGDMARPLKIQPEMEPYRRAERRVMACVCERFGLPPIEPATVRRADDRALAAEALDLFPTLDPAWSSKWPDGIDRLPEEVRPWRPVFARAAFLTLFRKLTSGGRGAGHAA